MDRAALRAQERDAEFRAELLERDRLRGHADAYHSRAIPAGAEGKEDRKAFLRRVKRQISRDASYQATHLQSHRLERQWHRAKMRYRRRGRLPPDEEEQSYAKARAKLATKLVATMRPYPRPRLIKN